MTYGNTVGAKAKNDMSCFGASVKSTGKPRETTQPTGPPQPRELQLHHNRCMLFI